MMWFLAGRAWACACARGDLYHSLPLKTLISSILTTYPWYVVQYLLDCHGHGTCASNGRCICEAPWMGLLCSWQPEPISIQLEKVITLAPGEWKIFKVCQICLWCLWCLSAVSVCKSVVSAVSVVSVCKSVGYFLSSSFD